MNYWSLALNDLRRPEFLGCEPAARATWLCVAAYCCAVENGGRIANCRSWKTRQWEQLAGVTKDEVDDSAPLLSWNGDDLMVWNYPDDQAARVAEMRAGGAKGNKNRWGNRPPKCAAAPPPETADTPPETPPESGKPSGGESGGESPTESVCSVCTVSSVSTVPSPPPPAGGEPPKEKRNRADGPAAKHDREVPEFLASATFASETVRDLFGKWLGERRVRRKYATAIACTEALAQLEKYPEPVQAQALRESIANGWQGVFPGKVGLPGQKSMPARPIQHLEQDDADMAAIRAKIEREKTNPRY